MAKLARYFLAIVSVILANKMSCAPTGNVPTDESSESAKDILLTKIESVCSYIDRLYTKTQDTCICDPEKEHKCNCDFRSVISIKDKADALKTEIQSQDFKSLQNNQKEITALQGKIKSILLEAKTIVNKLADNSRDSQQADLSVPEFIEKAKSDMNDIEQKLTSVQTNLIERRQTCIEEASQGPCDENTAYEVLTILSQKAAHVQLQLSLIKDEVINVLDKIHGDCTDIISSTKERIDSSITMIRASTEKLINQSQQDNESLKPLVLGLQLKNNNALLTELMRKTLEICLLDIKRSQNSFKKAVMDTNEVMSIYSDSPEVLNELEEAQKQAQKSLNAAIKKAQSLISQFRKNSDIEKDDIVLLETKIQDAKTNIIFLSNSTKKYVSKTDNQNKYAHPKSLYVSKESDTLETIAETFGTTIEQIRSINPDLQVIEPGTIINIPGS